MPTAPTIARPAPRARLRSPGTVLLAAAGVIVSVVSIAALERVLAEPERVDVVIENPTGHEVTVLVRADEGGPSQNIGPVGPRSTKEIASVVDQGRSWVIEYSAAGADAVAVDTGRADVLAGPVVVPAAVGDALERAGRAPRP